MHGWFLMFWNLSFIRTLYTFQLYMYTISSKNVLTLITCIQSPSWHRVPLRTAPPEFVSLQPWGRGRCRCKTPWTACPRWSSWSPRPVPPEKSDESENKTHLNQVISREIYFQKDLFDRWFHLYFNYSTKFKGLI